MREQIKHPCVQHKLAIIRDRETGHKVFRELATEITMFLCYEALKNIKTRQVEVQTPIATASCHEIDTDLVVVPILRAGVGMLDGILELVPTARVGFVGLYRDEETKKPVSYYQRFPSQVKNGTCIIIDPMLATGGSTVATIDVLKEKGAGEIIVVCIVTCEDSILSRPFIRTCPSIQRQSTITSMTTNTSCRASGMRETGYSGRVTRSIMSA
jgi:uracil phosphoribosyltransferase